MKLFLIKIFTFALCLVVIDQLFGFSVRYYEKQYPDNIITREEYLVDSVSTDLVIFGSSRASNHYNPKILSDSLGLTCYNAGIPGMGIITSYGFFTMLTQRNIPKYIILDVAQWFDYLYGGDDTTKYLGPLKPYYEYPGISTLFREASRPEAIKMHSWFYRYNSRIIETQKEPKTRNGYAPANGKVNPDIEISEPIYTVEIDPIKAHFFERFISDCKKKGIKLALFVSPSFKKTQTFELDYAKELASKEGIPYFSFWADTDWVNNAEYFHDSGHLNQEGADAYTRAIVPLIRQAMNIY